MIPIVRPNLPPLGEYVALLEEIWETRMLSNFGPMSRRLETVAAEYLGVEHVLTVSSGETGLMLALAALELPEDAPVYLPSFTFNSTINSVLWNRLRPVFVDIDPTAYTMDPAALARAAAHHGGGGAVLATHVFGNPCAVPELEAVARRHDCYLLFDAAHAYGSLRDGVQVGALGDAEVFSLSGTKLVTTAEGGLISTRHDWLAERLTYLRAHGFQSDYESKVLGLNGKFSELHAALGLLTLTTVEDAVTERHGVLRAYQDALGDLARWQRVRGSDRSTYKDICVGMGAATPEVAAELSRQGIQTKRYFRPLHTMPLFRRHQQSPLPATEEVYGGTLCLPAYSDMPAEVVDRVAVVARSVLTTARAA